MPPSRILTLSLDSNENTYQEENKVFVFGKVTSQASSFPEHVG